jgi:hypothetical protein
MWRMVQTAEAPQLKQESKRQVCMVFLHIKFKLWSQKRQPISTDHKKGRHPIKTGMTQGIKLTLNTVSKALCSFVQPPTIVFYFFFQRSYFNIWYNFLTGKILIVCLFVLIFYFFIIHMCIQLGHFSPLPPSPPYWQKLFALVSNFVEERV